MAGKKGGREKNKNIKNGKSARSSLDARIEERAGVAGLGETRLFKQAAAEVQARRRCGAGPGPATVLVKDLLEKMAAARLCEKKRGEGAVHLAARTGSPLLVDAALRAAPGAGAVDERSFNNWTPLHLAAALGHGEAVAALVAAGAETEARGGPSGRWPALALLAEGPFAS
jgi:hypothetical protein